MPTTVTDQFLVLDPAAPPAGGTPLNVLKYSLTDQNDDGDIDEFDFDAVSGLDVTASWPGDTVTIDVEGVGEVTYTGTTLYLSDGSRIFTPTDDQPLEPGDFVSSTYVMETGPLLLSELGPPCFTEGTLISTPAGDRLVEDLKNGDLVNSLDRGPIPLKYVHKRKLNRSYLEANPRHAPVLLTVGSLGAGVPKRTLAVSPQHRILLRSRAATKMFGASEVLVAAAHLVGLGGIRRRRQLSDVVYYHLLFDHHAIVSANGAETESLYLGANAMNGMDRHEYLLILNQLSSVSGVTMEPARPFIQGKRLRRLIYRHNKNSKPLVDSNGSSPGEMEAKLGA